MNYKVHCLTFSRIVFSFKVHYVYKALNEALKEMCVIN
jgi:hypothetical protein